MLIVDSQIHLWENETMNANHRQVRTYSVVDALGEMRQAGVYAALIHPPSSLPNTNATAIAAAKAYPDKFAVLGHFKVEYRENRDLVKTWKRQPGMLGFRFTFNKPYQQAWWTDGSLNWLWRAAERARTPIALLAA